MDGMHTWFSRTEGEESRTMSEESRTMSEEKKNEMAVYDATQWDVTTTGPSGMSSSDFLLVVEHQGTSPGWVYAKETQLGTYCQMILVGRREFRAPFGMEYNTAQKLKIENNPIVCRSADGAEARGIARMFTDQEIQLARNPAWQDWRAEVSEHTCVDKMGREVCPMAKSFVCKPQFRVFGFCRAEERGFSSWMPFFWAVKGMAVKEYNRARSALTTACLGARKKRLPPFAFFFDVELDRVEGKSGLVPHFSATRRLEDGEIMDLNEQFFESGVATQLWTEDTRRAYQLVEKIHEPPIDYDDAEA